MSALQHEHPSSRARQIGRVNEAVVAAANDDNVVLAA